MNSRKAAKEPNAKSSVTPVLPPISARPSELAAIYSDKNFIEMRERQAVIHVRHPDGSPSMEVDRHREVMERIRDSVREST
jgi:hypothetical protein